MDAWVWTLVVFIGYFAVLIGIAAARARRMTTMGDYVLGGRKLGTITTALSTGASGASGWTMLVLPALAFTGGMMHLWIVAAILGAVCLAWLVMAKRLRRYTIAADNALTIPEFFERRFGDTTGTLRGLAALISLYFIILYVCSGLIAGAKLLEMVFDLDGTAMGHDAGVILTLVAIVSYTIIGGFMAVSRTDVFQALIMLGGFFIIPAALLLTAGNPFAGLESTKPGFWNPFTDVDGNPLGALTVISAMGWGLGVFGSQRILARFMAMESEAHIGRTMWVSLGWLAVMYLLGMLMGLVAAPALIDRGIAVPDAERLYLVVTEVFFHPVVGGLLLTGVVAAVMSTADSQLLLASAIASDDAPLLQRISRRMRTLQKVWLGRGLLIVVGIAAGVISIVSPDSVQALVALAWGGMGAAFGSVTLMALYWRRLNIAGAYAGMLTGTAVSTFWWLMDLGNNTLLTLTESIGFQGALQGLSNVGVWEVNPAVPGMAAAVAAAWAASRLTAPPSDEITRLFDEVTSPDWREPAAEETEAS